MKQILYTGLLLGSCSATFLIQPRHTYLGKVVGWTLLYQLIIKKMSHRHVHRPTWKRQFFNGGGELGSVPVPSRCVNLTIKISHLKHNPVFMGYNALKALSPGFSDPRIWNSEFFYKCFTAFLSFASLSYISLLNTTAYVPACTH